MQIKIRLNANKKIQNANKKYNVHVCLRLVFTLTGFLLLMLFNNS